MISFVVLGMLLGVESGPGIAKVAPYEGNLLVTVGRVEAERHPGTAYIFKPEGPRRVPEPTVGTFSQACWGVDATELLLTSFQKEPSPTTHVELLRLDGTLQQAYPSLPVQDFVESDGRITRGGAAGPVRVSHDGRFLALPANGRGLTIMERATAKWVMAVAKEARDYDWAPASHVLAYSGAEGGKSALIETQIFLYDVDTGQERQLTRFPPSALPGGTQKREPLLVGVSWARKANVILFYNVPNRGIFVWTPEGQQVAFLANLTGECSRMTRISADGKRILYLSSDDFGLCLLNGGNSIRSINVDGTNDHAIVTASKGHVILDFDWREDSDNSSTNAMSGKGQ